MADIFISCLVQPACVRGQSEGVGVISLDCTCCGGLVGHRWTLCMDMMLNSSFVFGEFFAFVVVFVMFVPVKTTYWFHQSYRWQDMVFGLLRQLI